MEPLTLEALYAKLFIARPDVRAVQTRDGAYRPDRLGDEYQPFNRAALSNHLAGSATFGHYMLARDNTCKLFAFDIDLEEEGWLPTTIRPTEYESIETDDAKTRAWLDSFAMRNPREAWRSRADPARSYMKAAMRSLAHILQRGINDLEIPSAVAYTGYKGLHVYGFTGRLPAELVRDAALLALQDVPIRPYLGKNFFKWNADDLKAHEHMLFSIEVFPKQTELNDGGFGNLMRLPLGVNQKAPADPTFFVDTEKPFGVLAPTDAGTLLNLIDSDLKVDAA